MDREVVQNIVSGMEKNKEEIRKRWIEKMKEKRLENQSGNIPIYIIEDMSKEFTDLMTSNFAYGADVDYEQSLEFAERMIRFGWSMESVNIAIENFSAVAFTVLEERQYVNNDNLRLFIDIYLKWIEPLRKSIVNAFTEEWERTVRLQRIALQELSASLIPVFDKISIMPLVGTIDTDRARLIMENLLEGVVEQRAEVVLLDITGVPIVDTMVAHHLIQAAEAVRLVGAQCLLVGIRPEIAQTIVTLGIDLDNFLTTSTLQRGVREALRLTNRKIVEVESL